MADWTADQQREHRKLWVEALRSGKYQQTRQYLNDGRGMCCLGVACDISGLGRWETDGTVQTYLGDARMLPKPVKDWLGLNGRMGGFGGQSYLADINDSGKPFAEIADIIEAEPEGLIATPEAA